ncbi:Cytochrome P450, E-class, group I [Trema orientale]|uniref:Cytochrome P450, E-class, group I n=1 Tax=Trema orientale TaxID=63057 RepID=A0A2P5EVI6_TREOI|nr:Cytochrome P450, E-class, group I [Trema orientale]
MILELLALFLALALLLPPIFTSLFQTNRLPPSPTALPIIGHFHLLGPLIHRAFHRLSARYGPLFSLRLGSVPCVVVSSPDMAREFLRTNELSFISHANSIAINRLTYGSSLAFAPYGAYWKFIKKLTMSELLGGRTVSGFASLRAQEYRRLLRLLDEKSQRGGEAVNLTEELPKLANNIISHMMLGTSGSNHDDDDGRVEEARIVVREVTKIFGELNLSDFVWFFRKLDLQGFGKRIEAIFTRFDALVEKVISEREQLRDRNHMNKDDDGDIDDMAEVKHFIDVLLDYVDNEDAEMKLTRVHIKALIMDFFTAGTDTTAISTEWALAELINHPEVLQKAREEIDRVVGKSRLVSESDGPDLPYIQAIIKETLRLHPPVPLVIRKCVKQCMVKEYVIPEDTTVFVNAWAIGRNPNYWESPLDFRPERFLQAEKEGNMGPVDVKGQHFQVLPFGSGRRICPGMNLAVQMLPALVGSIIQCFDLTVAAAGSLSMEERPGFTAPRLHDLVCVPVSRLGPLNSILA